ncbi:MAG: galactokinase [Bacteroidia bacterium]|nr:galactokinase [Bacteroidia bacterium]
MDIDKLKSEFLLRYGDSSENVRIFFSPGRVNLIGEHTDYNGGFVLPFAIKTGTFLLIRKNPENIFRLTSVNIDVCASVPVNEVSTKSPVPWINYPLGVINEFDLLNLELSGYDLLFYGDIPNGAGLSSSASIEMVTAFALNSLSRSGLEIMQLVNMCRHAENDFVGMNCGIMDQMAVALSKKDHALFINCTSISYQTIPFFTGRYHIIIANTNKPRELISSAYNQRVIECNEAVSAICNHRKINNLSELNFNEFEKLSTLIKNEISKKRARHVITENQRVKNAVKCIESNDLLTLGKLMTESHISLKTDYEVTGFELDTLVEESLKIPGVAGSRMTGAGFGGCTISLVHKDSADHFMTEVYRQYENKTGLKPEFYQAIPSDGVHEIIVNSQ